MAVFAYKKYKVSISGQSKHTQGLQTGDIVRRQYKDGNNIIYTLMCVLYTGEENVNVTDADGSQKIEVRPYFVGALLDGDAPATGQVLDFVRVTNLWNADRLGALYLTASDEASPYMDVIDGIAVEQSLCFPADINQYSYEDSFSQYVVTGSDCVTGSYTKSGTGASRICTLAFNGTTTTSDAFIGITQDLKESLAVGEFIIVAYKIRANKRVRDVRVMMEYQDHSESDGVDTYTIADSRDWAYKVHVFSVDNSAAYKRNVTVDFSQSQDLGGNCNVEIADFNVIRLSSVANFAGGMKARLGNLTGVVDDVFGSLQDYGLYSQRLFASKSVNIAGTLTAGDENGAASTFYAGKIHKNVFIDSMNLSGCAGGSASAVTEKPTGMGVNLSGSVLELTVQSKAWAESHKGETYCFSIYILSAAEQLVTIQQQDKTIGSFTVEGDGCWHRYNVVFNILEYGTQESLLLTLSASDVFHISSPQLERGKYATQYQATDTVLNYTEDYGAWFSKGGVGGTIQNPLLRFGADGSIASKGDLFHINADGSGYFAGGAFLWNSQGIQLTQLVLTWDQLDSSIRSRIESGGVEWVANWNATATTIGENYVITPKIFAGTVTNNQMTGVYLGQLDENNSGIYGYNAGVQVFRIDQSGAEIGGWTITSAGLQSPAVSGRILQMLSGGHIKAFQGATTYWEITRDGEASFACGQVLFHADGSASFTGSITATSGSLGGWTLTQNRMYSANIAMDLSVQQGKYIAITRSVMTENEMASDSYLNHVIANGGVAMYYRGTNDWGLVGYSYDSSQTRQMFSLGSVNKIGCWNFDNEALWSGAKTNTLQSFTAANGTGVTIGTNGIRSKGWYLDKDGTVAFGHGTALFRANGSGYIANQNIVWGAGGNVTLGGGTSGFNLDGSGWVADHAISWNANGDVTFSNAVRLSFQGMVTASVIDNVLGDSAVLAATTNSITAKIQEAANGNPNLLENAALLGFKHIGNFPVWGDEHGDYIPEGYDGNFEHDCGVGLGSWDYYGHRTAWYHGTAGLNTHLYTCEWMIQQITDKLEPDTWYTFSFMLKGAATCSPLKTFVYPNACVEYTRDGEVGNSPGDVYCLWTATTEWTKHVVKFKTPQIIDKTYPIRLIFRIEPQDSAEFFVYVSQIKLEKGNESTAWNDGDTTKKLYDTGIDIQKRKIDITADTLTVRNNSGMQVFGSDVNGNLDVTAAISALSLNVKDLDGHVRLRFAMNNEQNNTVFIDDVEQQQLYNYDYPADTPMLIILDAEGHVIYSVAMTGARGYASYDNLLEYVSGFGTENLKTKDIQLYYDRAVSLPRMQRPYFTDYNFQYGYRGTLVGIENVAAPAVEITAPNSLHGVVRDIFVNESLTVRRISLYTVNATTHYKPVRGQSVIEYSCATSKGTIQHSVYISNDHTTNGECAACWDTYNDYLMFISTMTEFINHNNVPYVLIDNIYSLVAVTVQGESQESGTLRFHEIARRAIGSTNWNGYCQFLIDNNYDVESEMIEMEMNGETYNCPTFLINTEIQYGDTYEPVYYTY